MLLVLLTLAVFILAVTAMAIGVMLTGRRLQGSCGGTSGGACLCKDKPEGATPADCPRKHAPHAPSSSKPASARSLDVLR